MELSRDRKTRRPSVIWLDDQMPLLLEQVGHLNLRGFDVQPTDSVTGFLRALQGQGTNIAIIDIKLSGSEDGRALIDLVYESHPEIGIAVHSSYPEAFFASRYDTDRVRFVQKDHGAVPVEPSDPWLLADTLVDLVETLNGRRLGNKPSVVVIKSKARERPALNWASVQSIREFTVKHFVLTIVIAILLMKIVVLGEKGGPSLQTVLSYLIEVSGFVLPFMVAILLAQWFTPRRIREANAPEKFVQLLLEEVAADRDFRALINREITASGSTVPQNDFSALVAYYNILVSQRLWLARIVIAVFSGGVVYMAYDIVRDLVHLSLGRHG